jgi:hypothetical protein
LSHLPGGPSPKAGAFSLSSWLGWLGLARPKERACGQRLPRMFRYLVGSRLNGRLRVYRLGLCPRCFTIFWDTTRHRDSPQPPASE